MNKSAKIIMVGVLVANGALAQIVDPGSTAKRKATDRANSRIDRTIDKGLDKVEEGIGGLFKKKEKKKDEDSSKNPAVVETTTADTKISNSEKAGSTGFTTYSKFDFIPGEKIIAAEDFSQDAVGDFPAKWNTDGAGEVVTVSSKEGKWLRFSGQGFFYPDFLGVLDENCTIEFDLGADEAHKVTALMYFIDSKSYPNLLNHGSANLVQVDFDPAGTTGVVCTDGSLSTKMGNKKDNVEWYTPEKPFVKISVWRQKSRLRVYMNAAKVWDVPRAFETKVPYKVVFGTQANFLENRELLIQNVRVARGLPDTRSKLLTEGKFVTTGILFDTNSDVIKPSSYAVLKEIGQVLSENPGLKIRVTGHTDNQGDDKSNLALSAKRAASVKNALVNNWGIAAARIETDGTGESKPVADNTTSEGRATNRRVEFTRL